MSLMPMASALCSLMAVWARPPTPWGMFCPGPPGVLSRVEPQSPTFLTCLITHLLLASFPSPSHFRGPLLPENISRISHLILHSRFRKQTLKAVWVERRRWNTHTFSVSKFPQSESLGYSSGCHFHAYDSQHKRLSFLKRNRSLRHCWRVWKISLLWQRGCCYN